MPQSKPSQSNNPIEDSLGFENVKTPTIIKKNKQIKPNKNKGIPKEVANRMARRVAIATGIPTITGMGVFIGSYILISRGIADISPTLTLVTSAGCFLLGLLGLSYGILSASWDEAKGTLFGLENIRTNYSRMRAAFKNTNNGGE